MRQGLSRSAETLFKAMVPLKNSAVIADHPSHPSHSHSSYETGLLNTDYHQPTTHNLMVGQSSLSSQPRELCGNTGDQGSLDNDCTARAILQYRNTPIQNIGLSPAQLLPHPADYVTLYHPNPALYKPHADWIAAAKNHKIILSRRNARLIEQYNKTTRTLCSLQKGQIMTMQ